MLPLMAGALSARGIEVDVACTDDDGPGRSVPGTVSGQPVMRDGWRLFYFPKQTEFYKVSLPLMKWLGEHAGDYDVIHAHAVFSFSTIAAARAAAKHGVPCIVRPLGVLNRWGMEQRRRWVKHWSFVLLDRPLLRKAACIHYTSGREKEEAARLDLRTREAVIPLGIDTTPFDRAVGPDAFFGAHPSARDSRNILFMSRLDRKKGIELLLEAFARVRTMHSDLKLVLAGDGEDSYVTGLQRLAERLGVTGDLIWTGFLKGDDKLAAMAASVMFVLPSHSENFGIALLEAMAAGLPCIASDQVALAVDVAEEQALQVVPCESGALAEAICSLLKNPDASRDMGRRAAALVRRSYSLGAMGRSLEALYLECITKRPPP